MIISRLKGFKNTFEPFGNSVNTRTNAVLLRPSLDCGSPSQQRHRGKPATFLQHSTSVLVRDQATTALLLLRFRVWVMLIFRSTGFDHRLHWYGLRRGLGFTAFFSDRLAQDLAKA